MTFDIDAILRRLRRFANDRDRRPIEDARALAALGAAASPDRLRVALADGGIGIDDDEAADIRFELGRIDGDESLPSRTSVAVDDARPVAIAAACDLVSATDHRSGLDVGDDLSELPLLDLAAETATIQPDGYLAVRAADFPRSLDGLYLRWPGMILLRGSMLAEKARLADVFAHELSHALDPTAEAQTPAGCERFAEALGPRLLKKRPVTLDEAAPLINAADRQRPLPIGSDAADLLRRVFDRSGIDIGRATDR